MDTMTVKKRKRKCVLCCSNDSSEELRYDSQDQSTRETNPSAPFDARKPKKPSIWSRIGKFLRERFVPTRVHMRLRKANPIVPVAMTGITSRKSSVIAVPSLSVISEKLNEESELDSAHSFESNARKGKDTNVIVTAVEEFQDEQNSPLSITDRSPTTNFSPAVNSPSDALNVQSIDQDLNNNSKTYLSSSEDEGNSRQVIMKYEEVTNAKLSNECTNSNAWNGDSSDSFDEEVGKLHERNKKKKVTFGKGNRQQIFMDEDEQMLDWNKDFYKEHAIYSEKKTPAVSKRADKLKFEKNVKVSSKGNEFERENENFRKIKSVKRVKTEDTRQENVTGCFKKSDEIKGPSEGLHFDRESVLIIDKPGMKVRPTQTWPVKESSQPGKIVSKNDRRKVLAETQWTSGDEINKFKQLSSKKHPQDEFMKEKLTQFYLRKGKNDFVKRKSPYPVNTELSPDDVELTEVFVTPNNSANSSSEDLVSNQQEADLDEIRKTAQNPMAKSMNLALDSIDGVDWINKCRKDVTQYQSNLSRITEEKEPPQEKTKNIIKKIYDEVYVDYKQPSGKRKQDKIYTAPGPEYESPSNDYDMNEVTIAAKKNTIFIPKPPAKSVKQDIFGEKEETKRQKCQDFTNEDDYSYISPESTPREKYTADDLIQDIDSCLAEMMPTSAPPRPREATLAPNPFPVLKNNLPDVCLSRKRKAKCKKKKEAHNPLLAGIEDHPAVQRISAPPQLGKLKEVTNRKEPTPEVFLRTGKKSDIKYTDDKDTMHTNKINPITSATMGILHTKGKDSSMADVKVFDQDVLSDSSNMREDPEGATSEQQSSLYPVSENVPKNLTSSQKQYYTKLESTFNYVEKNLPDAKFWTDLSKGLTPNDKDRKVSSDICSSKESVRSSISTQPTKAIEYGEQESCDLGISKSEAELNELFFSDVASKPQFYKKSMGCPVTDTYNNSSNEEPVSKEICIFQHDAKNQDHSNAHVSEKEEVINNIPKSPLSNKIKSHIKDVNPMENLAFFRNLSKNPNSFQSSDGMIELSRSYFNEPPLGADEEMSGRRHSKENENLQFFLSVSRNSSGFYINPPEGESCTPHGYHPHTGYIPDDPQNYVDENTAKDNLKFFKNIGKSTGIDGIGKPVSLRKGKKKKKAKHILSLEDSNKQQSEILAEKAEETVKISQDTEDSNVDSEKT